MLFSMICRDQWGSEHAILQHDNLYIDHIKPEGFEKQQV